MKRKVKFKRKGLRLRYLVGLLVENFWDLVKLNLLFCLCSLPSVATFILGIFVFVGDYYRILFFVAVSAYPIGGAVCGCVFCITKILRNDPGYVWEDFWRKFTENVKRACIPGVLLAMYIYIRIYMWIFSVQQGVRLGMIGTIIDLLSIMIFGMLIPYVFTQIVYIDVPLKETLKNSALLCFSHLPRSFMSMITANITWIMIGPFFPVSVRFISLVLLGGFSWSQTFSLLWIWPTINEQFAIEETLYLRRETKLSNISKLF